MQFLDQHLCDELAIFIAPMLIGGRQPPGEDTAVTPWTSGVEELTLKVDLATEPAPPASGAGKSGKVN